MSGPQIDLAWVLDDPERGDIVHRVAAAPRDAAEAMLAELRSATAPDDAAARNLLGVATGAAGRMEEAVDLLRATVADHPACVSARLNLTYAYLTLSLPLMALRELEQADRHAAESPLRWVIQHRLQQLQAWRVSQDRELRLMRLRVAMLRERHVAGRDEPGDARRLGRILLQLATLPDTGVRVSEAVEALDRAAAENNSDVAAIEMLATALDLDGDRARLDGVLRRLEDVAPHSPILQSMRPMRDDQSEAYTAWQRRVTRLIEDAAGDGDDATTALAELRRLASASPRSGVYRTALLVVAMQRQDWPGARQMADELVAETELNHETHFNVAQVYWHNGDHQRALGHFEAAYQLARTDEERSDVLAMLSYLEERFGTTTDPGDG